MDLQIIWKMASKVVSKAVIAQTRAAIISIKCVESHKAKKNLFMAQEQMQRLT